MAVLHAAGSPDRIIRRVHFLDPETAGEGNNQLDHSGLLNKKFDHKGHKVRHKGTQRIKNQQFSLCVLRDIL